MSNIIQFAPLLSAVGAEMNYITASNEVEIVTYPKGRKSLIEAAVKDIENFLDVKTPDDILLFFALVNFIDNEVNPIPGKDNIKSNSGFFKDNKFIQQKLALLKTNKSWHTSSVAGRCSYFGNLCTDRGAEVNGSKRGRKATRSPNQYHELKPNGTISREQLITPSIEALYRAIPKEVVTSATKTKEFFTLEELQGLPKSQIEYLRAILEKV